MIRTVLAISACKLTRLALRLLHRGGTALPGKVALRLCPDLLGRLGRDVQVLLVTGTNGKTTTARMLEQAFADAGLPCFANRSGSNLIQGITAEFAEIATLTGRPKKKYAVIECDEAASKAVLGQLRPQVSDDHLLLCRQQKAAAAAPQHPIPPLVGELGIPQQKAGIDSVA